MSFSKPAKTYEEQLAILEGRGLTVENRSFALHCLAHHNYYRISAYRFPLTEPGKPDRFLPGTTFGNMWGLYCFDRQLRTLVMEALKRLEISVRSHWAYILGHEYGAQAYEIPSVFRNAQRHTSALNRLDDELARSHEVFVSHFKNKHNTHRPPIWAVCEIMTFGLLSRFYENIGHEHDRKKIAGIYGISPDLMKSLLEHGVYIRNLCAHHARLWNRRFTITVAIPKRHPSTIANSVNPLSRRNVYNTLVFLAHIVDIVEPQNQWTHRLMALLREQQLPVTEKMGFPEAG